MAYPHDAISPYTSRLSFWCVGLSVLVHTWHGTIRVHDPWLISSVR